MEIGKAHLFNGTVLISLPSLGMAVVSRQLSAASIGEPCLAIMPQGDSLYGAYPTVTYPPGTTVICSETPDIAPRICYIIAAAPSARQDFPLYRDAVFNPGQPLDAAGSVYTHFMFDTLIGELMQFVNNRNYGATGDTLPGDYSAYDREGLAGFHIGQLLLTLRGSSLSFMEFSGLDDRIRLFCRSYEQHTLLAETGNKEGLIYNNRAFDQQEAFGLPQGTPAAEETDSGELDFTPMNESIPFFRLQHVEGKAVGGSENLVVMPPEEMPHTADTPPFVVAADRQTYAGEKTNASALSLTTVKAPGIAAALQVGYGAGATDIREPYDYEAGEETDSPYAGSEDIAAEDMVDDAALALEYDIEAMSAYTEACRELMAKAGLRPNAGEDARVKQLRDSSFPGGTATGAASYPLPPSIELTDPVTGETKTYFASTSFISQQADGSILISDGYGSELRMSRGNIIISSALDTWIRPGRSCINMVPGHYCVNAQKTLTLNSRKGSYIRSVESLKLAGATGGAGVVLLESKAEAGIGEAPGGLVIKSATNLSVTGKDVYVGRNKHEGLAKGRVTEPDSGGALVLDAGSNGVLMQRCGALAFTATSVTLSATTDTTGAAIIITPQTISLCAEYVSCTGVFQLGTATEMPSVSRYTDNGVVSVTLGESSTPGLYVAGDMLLDGNAKINGNMAVCENFAARSVATSLGGGSGKLLNPEKALEATDLPELILPVTLASGVEEILSVVAVTVYQDLFVNGNAFSFPASNEYGMPDALRLPGMRWQLKANGEAWKEEYIIAADETMSACFPGYAAWENATISVEGYKVDPLNTGYITNA